MNSLEWIFDTSQYGQYGRERRRTPRGATFTLVWRVRTRLPERFGMHCRILVRASQMNSVLVEFQDGYKVVTSRHFVRPADDQPRLF